VALALECSDEYMRWRTFLSLQGRKLQEAASGPRPKTGGASHAVGCRLTSREKLKADWEHGLQIYGAGRKSRRRPMLVVGKKPNRECQVKSLGVCVS
jgi:hypothetical protein